MQKERFSKQSRSKLILREDGPFQIIERINDNVYKVDLLGEYDVSATFNIFDLSLFDVSDDSRTNVFEEIEDDTIKITPKDPSKYLFQVPIRPLMRSRVKKFKDAFNGFI
jgi:hypothetical protein